MLTHTWRTPLIGIAALVLAGAAAVAQPLRIGVTPGPLADSAEIVAKEAKATGLDVEVIEFTDWTTPNISLASGDIDVNYYQHQAFLDNANQQGGFRLRSIDVGLQGVVALFSLTIASVAEIPEGARIGIANDASNQARALNVLREAGLITLKTDAPELATLDHVAQNPKKLRFVEVLGPQLVRAIDDLDVVVTTPNNFVTAGRADVAKNGLYYSARESTYWAIQFVTRDDNSDDARVRQFIDIYQSSAAVAQQIHESAASDSRFYSLPWRKAE